MGTNGFRLRRGGGNPQRNGTSPTAAGAPGAGASGAAASGRDDDRPGYTRAFPTGPYPDGAFPDGPFPGGPDPYAADPHAAAPFAADPYAADPYTSAPYEEPSTAPRANVTTYRAGQRHPQVGAARLAWKPLLLGIFRHPQRTFAQMRVHQVWAPALIVSAVYGLLAVFSVGDTRNQVLNDSFSISLTIALSSAVGVVLAGLMFGGVTHVLARRLGGDGAWAPTVGLAMIITWATDVPRLLFSFFLPAANSFVQLLGWITWLACAGLLTSMVRQLHDLPWGKAAGAAAIQLIALLILIKLPTLS